MFSLPFPFLFFSAIVSVRHHPVPAWDVVSKGAARFVARNQKQKEIMPKRIYVENLPPDITAERLKSIFDQIWEVQSVRIKTDFLTIRPKCSGIVDMALDVDAYRAVNCFEGATFKNGVIHLKEEDPLMEKARTILTDIAEGYERVSSKIAKELEEKVEEIRKR
jgi:RNA recognition motif-containing protein